jgi:ubiquinone/menaquinone biosynthesis C-methylase UbiE
MSFTKYEARGAYHWVEISRRSPIRYSARLRALYDWFVSEALKRAPSLVIDVGCGDAALTHLIAQATGGRVVGIEPEPRGIELATEALSRAGSSVEVVLGRGEELPFDDGQASLVVMCELIEHLPAADALLSEAARVLDPATGALLLSTPQWQQQELREFHVHEYRASELEELLARFFDRVEVLVSEPPRLYDRYTTNHLWRLAINSQSALGRNPFTERSPAAGRGDWRELHAIASAPRMR